MLRPGGGHGRLRRWEERKEALNRLLVALQSQVLGARGFGELAVPVDQRGLRVGIVLEDRIGPVRAPRGRPRSGRLRPRPGSAPPQTSACSSPRHRERFSQGASGRSRRACRPRAFASSGERTRVTSDALSQFTHRIAMSAPPPGCAKASSLGTGSEEPQSGQVRPFSRAIRAARRCCWSESHALLATSLVYPVLTCRCAYLRIYGGVMKL